MSQGCRQLCTVHHMLSDTFVECESTRYTLTMETELYQKLKAPDSIRLLTILPGERGSPVHCQLEETRLSSNPQYLALSYTWGDPTLTHSITIDGQPKKIRYNLYTALQHFRHGTYAESIWIDALTINQDYIPERNQQVSIMNKIYSSAFGTLIWLREATEADMLAIEFLQYCDILDQQDTLTTEQKHALVWDLVFRNKDFPAEEMVKSLNGLLSSTWFYRRWIVQEFALSSKIIFCCGDEKFTLNGLSLFREAWETSSDAVVMESQIRKGIHQLKSLLTIRILVQGNANIELGFLLFMTANHFAATDPRDSVFSLLSLVNSPGPVLKADYNLTTAQVFSAAVQVCAESGTFFHTLSLSSRRQPSDSKQSLPSWVPDFHHHYTSHHLLQRLDEIYTAGGKEPPTFSFSNDGLRLTLKGKVLDTITALVDDVPKKNPPWDVFHKWYEKCAYFVSEQGRYAADENLADCWWRLAVCDIHFSVQSEYSRASSGFGNFYLNPQVLERLQYEEPVTIDHMQFLMRSVNGESDSMHKSPHEEVLRTKQIEYLMTVIRTSGEMTLCQTAKGYLGWTNPFARIGDMICVFEGAAASWVIRPKSDGSFDLIGEAYIHGVMYGEALDWQDCPWRDIQLS